MSILSPFIFVAIAVGGIVTALALRGGRERGHPRCAKCRYDLRAAPANSLRCPECGADLSPCHAVTMDSGAARPRLLIGGIAVLAITALVVGVRTVHWLDHVDWTAQTPTMWLAFRADSATSSTATAALDELIRRAESEALSDERLRSLAEQGLALQADSEADWEPRWGALIEHANHRGLMSPSQCESFLRHSIQCSMVLQNTRTSQMYLPPRKAEQIRKARLDSLDPLTVPRFDFADVEFVVAALRPGLMSRLTIDVRPLSASIGPWQCLDLPEDQWRSTLFYYRSARASPKQSTRVLWLPIVVEPGAYNVQMQWEVRIRFEDDPAEAALVSTMSFERALLVEPAEENAVPIATDAAATQLLKEAFSIYAIGFRSYKPLRRSEVMTMVYLRFDTGPHQRLHPGEPLAPFNGSLNLRISNRSEVLERTGSYLPGAWVPVVVQNDEVGAVDVQVRYSKTGISGGVGEGPGIGGQKPQPYWMGPPFEIKSIPITWFDTIEQANLSRDDLESIRFVEPR